MNLGMYVLDYFRNVNILHYETGVRRGITACGPRVSVKPCYTDDNGEDKCDFGRQAKTPGSPPSYRFPGGDDRLPLPNLTAR